MICCNTISSRYHWLTSILDFAVQENPQLGRLKDMCVPFSLGRRNCIGQNLANVEVVMVAAYLMRYFDFALTSAPGMELFLALKPTNVKMQVTARP